MIYNFIFYLKIILKLILMAILLGCSSVKVEENSFEKLVLKTESIAKERLPAPTYGPTMINDSSFVDKTLDYGLSTINGIHFYVVDFDADNYSDLVVLDSNYASPQFFKFKRKIKKFEAIDYNPFNMDIRVSYLNFVDLDKDGTLDLVTTVLNQKTELTKTPIRLFQGIILNNKILYVEKHSGLSKKVGPTASLVALDYNLDGWIDFFHGNWFDYSLQNPAPVFDGLSLAISPFVFEDDSARLVGERPKKVEPTLATGARPTWGVATCDIDQNGYPDILTASSSGHANRLWLNVKDERVGLLFKDYGPESGYASDIEGHLEVLGGGNTFFGICSDYNNDGIMDAMLGELSHSYDSENRDRSSILTGTSMNFPPKFIRTDYSQDDGRERWNQSDRRGVWLDYNLDGLVDVLVDNSGFPPESRLVLFGQESDHLFADIAPEIGIDIVNPNGTVVLDVNDDGRPDILTGQNNLRDVRIPHRLYLFENVTPRNGNRSLRFYLRAAKANIRGIGAMVILQTSEKTQRRWVEDNYGALASQNEEGILFGIGSEAPQEVRVVWPYLSHANGKSKNIETTYDLSKISFSEHLDLTLCESGKMVIGRNWGPCY
ncbi:MAG: hypothetical protein A2504_07765 [Bdellovibrionales bacterium RIFOXYD12_FULL_39_22]|nr:MAG: hypothetical protein A2385_11090 [Bdellovibrionales bacterium RIFOXYB1_FULL_39_21]OFZ45077.1 MAG: hypothetical protein A2404_11385 [Bdellovibrionales bacterium RIFOXYC1_FULL_39_130]OFZ74461.1 MAG: hypothetical protein A2560_11420 [Bdellovibrionales bacterium RIFOXYD1_FULL_39_84]OFZ92473.1 MAG: hypothetical protein A2504_07765 [Bdellovibrionales bacterium RIFOXYD12_FULL_39_22]